MVVSDQKTKHVCLDVQREREGEREASAPGAKQQFSGADPILRRFFENIKEKKRSRAGSAVMRHESAPT